MVAPVTLLGLLWCHYFYSDSDWPSLPRCARTRGVAKLGYLGHVLMENRHGLFVDAMLTQADGTAERDGALVNGATGGNAGGADR